MLSPRWRKVLRDVWLHKSRTLLVVLAIAIGIVGAGSVLNTWSLIRRVTRQEYGASSPASATLRTDSIDAALLARVRQHPAVRGAQARRTVVARAKVQGGMRTAMLFAVEDFTDVRIGLLKPEAGAWPPIDGTLVLEASSVDFAGVAVGDSIGVQFAEADERRLPVTGVARDVGLAPGWMEHVVYGFVTRNTLAQLGAPSSLSELQIVVNRSLDRDAVRRVAYEVKALIESTGRRVADVEVPVPGRHIHAGQIDSLLFTQGAFGMLAMLLSCILVVNLITAMLAGQVREIGVMKAVGARAGQIAAMYLGLALVLGVVATALALPLAAFVGRQYAQFTADLLNFSIDGFTIPRSVILLQLAVGVLLPVAAAAFPVLRGSRLSVSEALRDFGIDSHGGRASGRLLSAAGLTRPLLLSLRNAFRKRQRMVLTLMTLATGGAVYIGALNLRASIIGSVDLLFSPQRYDMVLRFAQSWPADSLEALVGAVPGVARVEAWSGGRAAVRHADGTLGAGGGEHGGNTFALTAPPPDSKMYVPAVESGRWFRGGDGHALVVNRRLLEDEPNLTVGAEVTLIIAGRPSQWTVVGVAETGPSPAAYVPREALAGMLSGGHVNVAVVAAAVAGSASQLELIQRVRTELERNGIAVQSSQLLQQARRVMEDHLLMVAGFLGIMAQLMIVVGGLGLASTMSLGVLERTREIGVLRAIGARHRAILTIVQIEGLVVAVASWLIALPLSLPMSVILGKAFGEIMIRVPITYVPEPTAVVRWLAVVVGVSLVACAWPAFRATRIPTAAALAYE